jgi:hypothetical protein
LPVSKSKRNFSNRAILNKDWFGGLEFMLALNLLERPALKRGGRKKSKEGSMKRLSGKIGLTGIALLAMLQSTWAADAPQFEVDRFWPKTLPNSWIIGQVGGI